MPGGSSGWGGWSSALLRTAGGQLTEERVDEFAGLLPTVEATPQHPQPADELVAGVDGTQIAIRLFVLPPSHQQRLDVVGEQGPPRVGGVDRGPSLEVEIGLGCPRRSRGKRDGAIQSRVAEEEREADRDLQQFPSAAIKREVGKRQVPVGNGAVAQLRVAVGEQQIAAT